MIYPVDNFIHCFEQPGPGNSDLSQTLFLNCPCLCCQHFCEVESKSEQVFYWLLGHWGLDTKREKRKGVWLHLLILCQTCILISFHHCHVRLFG